MDVMNILSEMGGLKSIASELGIDENQAKSGAAALAPAILGGLKKQAQGHPSGLSGLTGLLGELGGGGLLDEVLGEHPTNTAPGNQILGQIFGSKDVSRTVAQHASTQSGLAPEVLKKMLPMLAMAVAGYMAKQHAAASGGSAPAAGGGGLGNLLGSLLGGQGSPQSGGAGGGTTSGSSSAQGGLASMLDMDGDGNPLDDILKMAGKALG